MLNDIAVVTTWEEFRRQWMGGQSRQNFLLRGEIFPHHFTSPLLEAVLAGVWDDAGTRLQRGGADKTVGNYPLKASKEAYDVRYFWQA